MKYNNHYNLRHHNKSCDLHMHVTRLRWSSLNWIALLYFRNKRIVMSLIRSIYGDRCLDNFWGITSFFLMILIDLGKGTCTILKKVYFLSTSTNWNIRNTCTCMNISTSEIPELIQGRFWTKPILLVLIYCKISF